MMTLTLAGDTIRIPGNVLRTLRDCNYSDQQIMLMTRKERFINYCQCEGLLGSWGHILWETVGEMRGCKDD